MKKNNIVSLRTDQRRFVMIYCDCLESKLFETAYEKLLFIALKSHADDGMQCFPSLDRLAEMCCTSKKTIQRTLKELVSKGIIKIQSRTRNDGGNASNLYTLYDYAETWITECEEDTDDKNDEKHNNDAIISKEKEPVSPTNQSSDTDSQSSNHTSDSVITKTTTNNTTFNAKCQYNERYSLDEIKTLFDYDIMTSDKKVNQDDIDSVINILYKQLNTSKLSVKICGQNIPSSVVQSKLMKLSYESILYAIDKFNDKRETLTYPEGYMLAILYQAQEQYHLHIMNQLKVHNPEL